MGDLRIPEKVTQALLSRDVRNLPLPKGKFDCQYTLSNRNSDVIRRAVCDLKEIRGRARKFIKSLMYFRILGSDSPLSPRGPLWGLICKGTWKTAGKEYQFTIEDLNMDGRLDEGDLIYLDDGDGNKKMFSRSGEDWLVFSGHSYSYSSPHRKVTKRDIRKTLKPLQAMYQSALRMAGFKLVRM